RERLLAGIDIAFDQSEGSTLIFVTQQEPDEAACRIMTSLVRDKAWQGTDSGAAPNYTFARKPVEHETEILERSGAALEHLSWKSLAAEIYPSRPSSSCSLCFKWHNRDITGNTDAAFLVIASLH
ncbi:hypothetical protein J6590_075048, partial [Homalodisca vitripennis]